MDESKHSKFETSKNSYVLDDKYNLSAKFGNNTSNSLDQNKTIYHFKIVLLGNIAVGKTCILGRFIGNNYSSVYKCTINVDFRVKTLQIDETSAADLKVWDTCGQEQFRSIAMQYYRDANGAILVFDLTNRESFTTLSNWINELRKSAPSDVIIVIVGNKADLESNRVVSMKELNDYLKSQNCEYIEVSAKTGMNILLLFEELSNMLIKQNNSKKNANNISNNKKNNQCNHYEPNLYSNFNVFERKSLQNIDKQKSSKYACC